MKTTTHRAIWFMAYFVCLTGLALGLLGLVANRHATKFDYDGSSTGYYQMVMERFRSADAFAKTGAVVAGAGMVVMLAASVAGPRQRRHCEA